MTCALDMFVHMPVLGGITAAHVAADQAHPQVSTFLFTKSVCEYQSEKERRDIYSLRCFGQNSLIHHP